MRAVARGAVNLGGEFFLLRAVVGERERHRAGLLAEPAAAVVDAPPPAQPGRQDPGDEILELAARVLPPRAPFVAAPQVDPVEAEFDPLEGVLARDRGAVTHELRPVHGVALVVGGARRGHGLDFLDPRRRVGGEPQVDTPAEFDLGAVELDAQAHGDLGLGLLTVAPLDALVHAQAVDRVDTGPVVGAEITAATAEFDQLANAGLQPFDHVTRASRCGMPCCSKYCIQRRWLCCNASPGPLTSTRQ